MFYASNNINELDDVLLIDLSGDRFYKDVVTKIILESLNCNKIYY